MVDFDAYPNHNRYRALHVTDPLQRGLDVYALQTALTGCGFDPGPHDGILGRTTGAAIRSAQQRYALVIDGIAGGLTQRALALDVAIRVSATHRVTAGALKGQLEHESSLRLGNYSAQRPDGSYDAGVAQFNTAHTPASEGFDAPVSIDRLARTVRKHFDLFDGVPARRRWALAQGAHNAPAYACWIARAEGALNVTSGMTLRPSVAARSTFEAYVASVSVYLTI